MKVKQILHLLEGDIHFLNAPKQYCQTGIHSDQTDTHSLYEWSQMMRKPEFEALADCTVRGIKSLGFEETVVFLKRGKRK